MTRINLLGHERAVKTPFTLIDPAKRVPIGAGLIFVLTAAGIGGWYWSLTQTAARMEADMVTAQQQAEQLKPVLVEVQTFERRRAALQQRVSVIEQLRGGQQAPVQLLDAVSRSVPDLLWLTSLNQTGNAVTIEGRSNTLIALSDFVGNLGGNGLLEKPIEIVSSQVESVPSAMPQGPPTDLIKFTVKAQLAPTPTAAPAVVPAANVGGAR